MNKIIYRKSIPTNEVKDRTLLLRIVKLPSGEVVIDETYNLAGRGVYLERDIHYLPLIKKKRLIERGLRIKNNIEQSFFDEIENKLKK